LAKFKEPAPNPEARAVVATIRAELVQLFSEMGAASNQIGKTYRYLPSLKPETRTLIEGLKRLVDPDGRMNPGALGL
jgi:FAD/FMN-containing dehydrogenase